MSSILWGPSDLKDGEPAIGTKGRMAGERGAVGGQKGQPGSGDGARVMHEAGRGDDRVNRRWRLQPTPWPLALREIGGHVKARVASP